MRRSRGRGGDPYLTGDSPAPCLVQAARLPLPQSVAMRLHVLAVLRALRLPMTRTRLTPHGSTSALAQSESWGAQPTKTGLEERQVPKSRRSGWGGGGLPSGDGAWAWRPRAVAVGLMGLVGLGACNGDVPVTAPAPTPARVEVRGGAQQRQLVGTVLAEPLVAFVSGQNGTALRGIRVRFQTTGGSAGTVLDTVVTTTDDGRAASRFRLGSAPGEEAYLVEARLPDYPGIAPVTWRATGLAGAVSRVESLGDTSRLLLAGDSVVTLRLQTFGVTGTPLDGVPVRWTISGPGTLSAAQSLSDEGGVALVTVRPSGLPGLMLVTAVVDGGPTTPTTWRLTVPARGDIAIRLPTVDGGSGTGSPRISPLMIGSGTSGRVGGTGRAASLPVGRGRPDSQTVILRIPTGPVRAGDASAWTSKWVTLVEPLRARGVIANIEAHPFLGILRVQLAPWQPYRALLEGLRSNTETATITLRPQHIDGRRRMQAPSLGGPTGPGGLLARAPEAWRQQWAWTQIGLTEAWQGAPKRGRGIIVGVVDDGIRFEHPALSSVVTQDGYDFVSEGLLRRCDGGVLTRSGDGGGYDPDPTQPVEYGFVGNGEGGGCVGGQVLVGGHGLQVMSALGGVPSATGGAFGVAPEARMRPVRAFDVAGITNEVDIANAIRYAAGLPVSIGGLVVQAREGKAHILNLSYAGPEAWALESQAVQDVISAGVLVVAAAGNTGDTEIQYPAALGGVIGVSSTDPAGQVVQGATRGSWVTLLAPGGSCGASDGTPEASQVWLAEYDFLTNRPRWGWSCGTSYAAPVVAGVAALLWAEEPTLTAATVRARMVGATRQEAGQAGASQYGLLDARLLWPPADLLNRRYAVVATRTSDGQAVAREEGRAGDLVVLRQLSAGTYHVWVEATDALGRPLDALGARTGPLREADGSLAILAVAGGTRVERTAAPEAGLAQLDRDTVNVRAYLIPGRVVEIRNLSRGQTGLVEIPVTVARRYRIQLQGLQAGCGVLGQGQGILSLTTRDGTPIRSATPPTQGGCPVIETDLAPGLYRVSVSRTADGPLGVRVDGM